MDQTYSQYQINKMEIIQASYLNSERGKNEIKKERKCEDQVTAPLEADGGRRMNQTFIFVKRGHPKAMAELGYGGARLWRS